MQEIWKDIKGYEGMYQVSNLGRVKSIRSKDSIGRKRKLGLLSLQIHQGYVNTRLMKNGIRKTVRIHRLVAQAFLKRVNGKPEINHIDGNKENNNVKNLEWVSRSENVKHAYNNGLIKQTSKRRNDYRSKPIMQILNNEIINEFPSAMEASRKLGFPQGNISRCCRGKQKTAYGYLWKYK